MATRSTASIVKEVLADDKLLSAVEEAVNKAIDKKLTALFDRIDQQDGKIFDLQQKIDESQKQITELNQKVENANEAIRQLRTNANDQEQYSRRNCLRFYGVEEKVNENTDSIVCKIAQDYLDIDLSTDSIERSHRVGRRSPPSEGSVAKPRAIIVKFTSYRQRQRIILNKKKLKTKKTGISVYEDLTPQNRSLLWDAFRESKKENSSIITAWTIDGKVIVSLKTNVEDKTITKRINSKTDIENL